MSKKCGGCVNFTKFGNDNGLCEVYDYRTGTGVSARYCKEFKAPKYVRDKKKVEAEYE